MARTLWCCLAVTLVAGPLQAQNLLTNGSFEMGPAIPGGSSFFTVGAGSTAIPGWTVTSGNVDYIGPSWTLSDGIRGIDLDGAFSAGSIGQSVVTVPGRAYVLTFDLAGNPDGAPTVKQLRVSVGDQTHDLSFDTQDGTREAPGWQRRSFAFVASGPSAAIGFSSLSPGGNSWGALIDNVSVTDAVVCDLQLDQATYGDGDLMMFTTFRFANPGAGSRAVEIKVFLNAPGVAPIGLLNVGADGSAVLPAGFDQDFGPAPFLTVTAAFPRGGYQVGCRMLDPVTGELLAEDLNFFGIQ